MQVKYAYTIIRSSLSQCNLGFYMVIKGITIHVFFSSKVQIKYTNVANLLIN